MWYNPHADHFQNKGVNMQKIIALLLTGLLVLCGCVFPSPQETAQGYRQITPAEAYTLMKLNRNCIILDVRTRAEFAEGHIPGAICIPNETIGDAAPEALPDKDRLILVYCRSGNRSKQASAKLAGLGYTNIVEFGGIRDWTGPVTYGY